MNFTVFHLIFKGMTSFRVGQFSCSLLLTCLVFTDENFETNLKHVIDGSAVTLNRYYYGIETSSGVGWTTGSALFN